MIRQCKGILLSDSVLMAAVTSLVIVLTAGTFRIQLFLVDFPIRSAVHFLKACKYLVRHTWAFLRINTYIHIMTSLLRAGWHTEGQEQANSNDCPLNLELAQTNAKVNAV